MATVQSAEKRRILIIDDDSELTSALTSGIERYGAKTTAYNDPIKAVENFKAGDYDFVLLDFRMPEMSGFEVYRELRKIDKDVKIGFLTGFDVNESEFSVMFPETKIQAFLKKPIELSTLMKKVEELMLEDSVLLRSP